MAAVDEHPKQAEWRKLMDSMKGVEGKRWARPAEPILHTLNDEKSEPHTFFHNLNYRASRKFINVEKIKILKAEAIECVRSAGHARYHKCAEINKRLQASIRVASNVDRGPLARKRDVAFVYTIDRLKTMQRECAELEIPYTMSRGRPE